LATQVIDWRDGATLPYLGQTLTLRLDPEHRFGSARAQLQNNTLHLSLPHAARPEQMRDTVQAWLMAQAKTLFCQRLDHFAPLLGVRWTKLSLSNAGTRWGSASADGSIRLNWRLIHMRASVIDYVVAHELSHLRVMNHSAHFWDTVRTVVPDYAALRRQLKSEPAPR
jgi:predicted metal-dependent hydrolase